MAKKSFKTYKPTETSEFELNDEVFRLQPVPGAVLLDFLAGADTEDPAAMAKTVNALLDAAIVEDDKERWKAYVTNPANSVDLNTLAEIAGFVAEVSSSGNPHQRPVSSLTG